MDPFVAKFLLFLLTLVVVWVLFLRPAKRLRRYDQMNLPTAPERMVACAHCGVFVPESEAVSGCQSGRFFCGEAHRRLDDAGQGSA